MYGTSITTAVSAGLLAQSSRFFQTSTAAGVAIGILIGGSFLLAIWLMLRRRFGDRLLGEARENAREARENARKLSEDALRQSDTLLKEAKIEARRIAKELGITTGEGWVQAHKDGKIPANLPRYLHGIYNPKRRKK